MIKKLNYKYLFSSLLIFLILLFSFIGIFIGSYFSSSGFNIFDFNKDHSNIPLPTISWIPLRWTFPFYFTIQSNILVMIYLFLIGLNILKPNKSKSSFIFELIVLLNISITFLVFWFLLLPQIGIDNFCSNKYSLIENILLHAVTPLFMFIIFFIRFAKTKNKNIFLNYKHFSLFLIYPIIWLLISIIIYYSSRYYAFYIHSYHFQTKEGAIKWQNTLNKLSYIDHVVLKGKVVTSYIPGWFGNAVYFFLNFDNVSYWVPIISVMGIAILFVCFSLILISITNPKYKLYIWINAIKNKIKK